MTYLRLTAAAAALLASAHAQDIAADSQDVANATPDAAMSAPNESAFEMDGINPAIAEFDVAGVKLGMTPEQAFGVLEAAGYERGPVGEFTGTMPGPSFDELVRIVSGDLQIAGATASWREATYTKDDQAVHLDFVPTPAGVVVREVTYEHMGEGMTLERFQEMAVAKYGEPRMMDAYYARWSDEELLFGDSFDEADDAVQLKAMGSAVHNADAKVSLTLRGGGFEDLDAEAMARERVTAPAATF